MLALQLNFVTREQLIAATSKWTRDRSRSIAEILSSDGVLSDQESTLLSSLVDMHLARHGNDPRRTLASIDVPSEARTLVEAAGDATMLETINHLAEVDPHETIAPATPEKTGAAKEGAEDIAAHQTMGPGETGTAKPQADPTVKFPTPLDSSGKVGAAAATAPGGAAGASRYTVIKPYQRGGLGQVSIARDEEINREVALKEILPKHADSEEARARFVLEAEVTGSLEHPGVVPLYGLG